MTSVSQTWGVWARSCVFLLGLPYWVCRICSAILAMKRLVFQDILQGIGGCWKGLSSPRRDHILGWYSVERTLEHNKKVLQWMFLSSLLLSFHVPGKLHPTCVLGLSRSCLNKGRSPRFTFFLSTFQVASPDLLCELSDHTSVQFLEWSSPVGSCLLF